MDATELPPGVVPWAVAILIGFPLAMLIAGEAIVRLKRRGQPIVRTVRIVRTLVLPSLAAFLLLHEVVGLGRTDTLVMVVETVTWIFLIHAALSFVNDVVFKSAAPGSWQSRVPQLFVELIRLILVLVGAGIVLSQVWGLPLTRIATTLGVGSIVIGLALQEPLGNVFAGLMLLFERPVAVGDWIQVDGTTGRIAEINWRAVHILTTSGEMRVVPNSSLYKGSFSNLSRPDALRTEVVELTFSYDDAPNTVKDAVLEVLTGLDRIVAKPAPMVQTIGYDATVHYRVSFTVARHDDVDPVRDEFLTRIWYVARRHGLTLAQTTRRPDAGDRTDLVARGVTKLSELLRGFPPFSLARNEVWDGLEPQMSLMTYATGERLVAEGQKPAGLYVVVSGTALLSVRDALGHERELAHVGRGEYFGESTLVSSRASEFSARALTDLQVIVIQPEGVRALVEKVPRVGRELGNALDLRRRAARNARRGKSLSPSAN